MATYQKVMSETRNGRLFIHCPRCRRQVELCIGKEPDDYQITTTGTHAGQVFPDYVCMERPNGHYCQFAGPIWIVNY